MEKVSKRSVFYISGFDPRGASYYHGLYRRESARQTAVNGMTIVVGARRRECPLASNWTIQARDGEDAVATTFEFLHWDDIVRANWTRNRFALVREIAKTFWRSWTSGHLGRLRALSWPFALTALMPVIQICAAFALAIAVMAGCAVLLVGFFELSPWLAALAGGIAGVVALNGLLALCERLNAFWIARLISVTVRSARGEIPAIDERCREFARYIRERCAIADCDEALIVGHSVGSELAVKTIALLLSEGGAFPPAHCKLSLLTLGQTIPGHGLLPEARAFRADLLAVASAAQLAWIDFSAPPDPACMALVDPVVATGMQRLPGAEEKPKLLSPRFVKLFDKERYAALRKRKMTMHFMYLLATDKSGDYDYFAITAGSKTLADRYGALVSVRSFDRLRGGRRRAVQESDER